MVQYDPKLGPLAFNSTHTSFLYSYIKPTTTLITITCNIITLMKKMQLEFGVFENQTIIANE